MAWNISLMCVKAGKEDIDKIIPDIFYHSEENLFFEDATSNRMKQSLGVTFLNGWIIIVDVLNRITFDEAFPLEVSKNDEVRTFYISENPIFRNYTNGICTQSVKGIPELDLLLANKGILPEDKYGETKSIQLFEYEILDAYENGWMEQLFVAKFAKYDLD